MGNGFFDSFGGANSSGEEYGNLIQSGEKMIEMSEEMNRVFGQMRERMDELNVAVADATPKVIKLGGSYSDVLKTIQGVSEATKTNIVASEESISKLYAATQLIGRGYMDVESLVKNFSEVGVNFTRIGEQMEQSMQYTRSLGVNSRQVMQDVVNNTDKLNKYNFEGGVAGLTKMAAQAAMLRVDMSVAFGLADKVMDPQGAIEVASAFQRLGVAAGTLVDPFALMNASINDPEGLQSSLGKVAEQYTYFDEKTKTFKINPQGVFVLKEMEREAGLASGTLSKMGLASKELSDKMSQLKFDVPEESKQYLANIATMSKDGEWEVKVKDARGDDVTKKLSDISKEEMDKLIEEQKKEPKTLEEIQRSQMSIQKATQSDIAAIKEAVTMGFVSTSFVRQTAEAVTVATKSITNTLSDRLADTGLTRGEMEKQGERLKELIQNIGKTGDFKGELEKYASSLDDLGTKAQTELTSIAQEAVRNLESKMGDTRGSAAEFINKSIVPELKNIVGMKTDSGASRTSTTNVNFGGKVEFALNAPPNIPVDEFKKYITGKDFQDYIKQVIEKHFKETGRIR